MDDVRFGQHGSCGTVYWPTSRKSRPPSVPYTSVSGDPFLRGRCMPTATTCTHQLGRVTSQPAVRKHNTWEAWMSSKVLTGRRHGVRNILAWAASMDQHARQLMLGLIAMRGMRQLAGTPRRR